VDLYPHIIKLKVIKLCERVMQTNLQNLNNNNMKDKIDRLYVEIKRIRELKKEIGKEIKKSKVLDKREKEIMLLRCVEIMTFEEVAKVIGVTRERVRQIEVKCFDKLDSNFNFLS